MRDRELMPPAEVSTSRFFSFLQQWVRLGKRNTHRQPSGLTTIQGVSPSIRRDFETVGFVPGICVKFEQQLLQGVSCNRRVFINLRETYEKVNTGVFQAQ